MPAKSMIVGVDLAPIKPIPKTITFQSDITTEKCRTTIKQHFKGWKADVVLHDGAPNVGTAWVQDAFSQAELVLQALKLATEFLVEDGIFVTKVFRSKDYNALLWVLNQIFSKVEATKPPSSRNVSAEIYVMCRGFRAPKRIDPKLLDPRFVFAELSNPKSNNEAKVFNPEKKKRKREGYEEGNYTHYREAPASEFIQTADPIAMLGSFHKLTFEQPKKEDITLAALSKLPETTNDIRQCCMDLRVLGRKEFRTLLRWRLKARDLFGLISKISGEDPSAEEITEVTPMDQELQIQEDLQRLNDNETSRKKREKRRENERKQKGILRMQMHMTTPIEIGLEQKGPSGEDSMFVLAPVDSAGAVEKFVRGTTALQPQDQESADSASGSQDGSDAEEDRLGQELDALYIQYQERKLESNAKYRENGARIGYQNGDWEGFSDHEESSSKDFEPGQTRDEPSSAEEEGQDPQKLIYPQNHFVRGQPGLTQRAVMFFGQDLFQDIDDIRAVDEDNDRAIHVEDRDTKDSTKTRAAEASAIKTTCMEMLHQALEETRHADARNEQSSEEGEGSEEANDQKESGFEIVKAGQSNWETEGEPQKDGRLDIDIVTAEAMSLAQQIALGQKSTQDLVNDAFNKYSFRDTDGLPDWFLDDEGKHSKPHRPISAAGAAAIKEKLRALNARPIKKIREAKDRKKFKAAQRLEKLRKKSALVADDEGISEKDKALNIARMMSKSAKKKPKKEVRLVVAKGGNKGIPGRPRGVKGRYKIVDARLKKDIRAEKRLTKKRQ